MESLKNAEEECQTCKLKAPVDVASNLDHDLTSVVRKVSASQIALGKKLVEADGRGKCVMCHSAGADMLPLEYQFIPSDKDAKKAQSVAVIYSKPKSFANTLEDRLIKTKTMPPDGIAPDLTDEDRDAIKAYVLSLMKKE